jgi:DNA-binding transcriptional LysR family regulator
MKNIPTDLLRTFVLVVDLRNFTRAAKLQGVTQPAVSAQIRRLQSLIGAELLDKSTRGVSLTPMGQQVVNSARRILAINDQILNIARGSPATKTVRVGIPGDCMGADLGRILAGTRAQWPHLHFAFHGAGVRRLLQGLHENVYDVVLGLVIDKPAIEARHYWTEPLAWVRSAKTGLDPDAPVPLVSYNDICVCHRIAVSALSKVGRSSDLVFRATTAEALRVAVAEGVGTMVVPRSRVPPALMAWDDGPLPALPDVQCGVFLAEHCEDQTLVQIADRMAEAMGQEAREFKVV